MLLNHLDFHHSNMYSFIVPLDIYSTATLHWLYIRFPPLRCPTSCNFSASTRTTPDAHPHNGIPIAP